MTNLTFDNSIFLRILKLRKTPYFESMNKLVLPAQASDALKVLSLSDVSLEREGDVQFVRFSSRAYWIGRLLVNKARSFKEIV